MRIGVGMVYHESNTFFSQPMTLSRFREKDLHYGDEILSHWTGTASEIGGFLEAAQLFDFEPIPTIAAWGVPAGPLTDETFESICDSLCARLKEASPLDGVLLALHGAMVSQSFPDADGELLRRLRRVVGTQTPISVTLDYHANVTEEMMLWPDSMIGYDTYPHVDQAERGIEAAKILLRIIRQGLRSKLILRRLPLLPHILRQFTDVSPMREAIVLAHEFEKRAHIVSVSVATGFPYSDVPKAGFSVYAVAETESAGAEAVDSIATYVWDRRTDFEVQLPQAGDAVREAMGVPKGPVILADIGDNVGAGTPADGTVLLSALIEAGARNALVLLCDKEAVDAAVQAGVRSQFRFAVGGKIDNSHGSPVLIEGTVRLLSDGIFKNVGPMRDGVVDDQGRTAVIDAGGVLIVLTERRMPMWNLQQLRFLGIEPTALRIIVVKAAIAYRAAYAPIAQRIIEVDTPGLAAADLRRFNFQRLQRPVYPLDPI